MHSYRRPARWRGALAAGLWLAVAQDAAAQSLDLGNPPAGAAPLPVQITASNGIQWVQSAQTVTAIGDAKAVRGQVTVTADELVAHYRKKAGAAGAPKAQTATKTTAPVTGTKGAPASAADAASALDQGGSEIYELDAVGHVHIFTLTDNAYGDRAVYSLDADVLVLTGAHIKLTTQHDVITARDSVEYYSAKRMAVARGNALIVADDGRSIAADTLVGYLDQGPQGNTGAPPPPKPGADDLSQAGQLRKVDAIGHVVIHTQTDTATGDRGVYLPKTGQARLGGNVHIIRGPNELSGADALVNMKTGVATLLAGHGHQVAGTIMPNSPQLQGANAARAPK